ncbi:MAG: PKD domain-containing protein, partial [Cyclobacteriaceae bacterium]|nr:PKD domain-containing protein [Cyclobacteriaceae bacterium]
ILAGVGQKFVYYNYADVNGCANTYLDSILVNPTPDIDFGIDPAVCENADQIPLTATPTGGTFEGTGVTSLGGGSYIFDPDVAGVGDHLISYAFTDPETGATDTAFQQVSVLAVPMPDFSIDSFTCVDSLIRFTDQSTIDPSSTITEWIWKFGDGSEDTARNPRYQYEAAGIYYATLRVFSQPVLSTVCTDITGLVEIRIGGRPDVKMTASNFVSGDITQFTDLTTFPEGIADDAVATWNWDFDDGNFGTEPNPAHAYAIDGKYTVYLDVQSARGCVDRDSLRIAIIPVVQQIDPVAGWTDDFEFLDAWVAEPIEDTLNSWMLGFPSGNVINGPAGGQNAWVTSLTGTYNNLEKSWLKSPAFDLTGLTKPMVQFNYWSDMNATTDGVTMEYSIDGGANWRLIGNKEGLEPTGTQWYGINWYDGDRLFNVFDEIEGVPDNPNKVGWTEPSNGWKTARIYLDPIIERHGYGDPVIFRFTLEAGATSIGDNKNFEGFAIDNFTIKNRTQNILIEQFVDFSSNPTQFFIRNQMYPFVYDTMTYTDHGRNVTDVIYLETHYNFSGGDEIYKETPGIAARYDFYGGNAGTSTSPQDTKADGVIGEKSNLLMKNDVLRRALYDPKFGMVLTVDEAFNSEPERTAISVKVILNSNEDFDEQIKLYVVVLEDNFDKFTFQNISVQRNLGRQMISNVPDAPSTGGIPLKSQWSTGEQEIIEFTAELVGFTAGNPDEFKVIAFVQNQENQDIYQAVITDSPYSKEPKPVGIEDEIAHEDLKQINIYPQPAQHYTVVDFGMELSRDYDWEIIDQRGVVIGRGMVPEGQTGFEINTGLLPNGIHFLLIGDNQGLKIYRKLSVIH